MFNVMKYLNISVLSDRTLKGKARPDSHVEFVLAKFILSRMISGTGDVGTLK